MKALAELLAGLGWKISGSDQSAPEAIVAALARRGLVVQAGHNVRYLPDDADVLVYSPAIGPENAERRRALQMGIPQFSYSQMLGALMKGRRGVCIAGTHGKSTTTAMTGWILSVAGFAPSVVIGAEVREAGVSGWSGAGEHFVVESCEFQRSFLDLSPRYAAILGVEPDHFDCFAQFDETIAAFAAFAQKVPASGRLLVPAGCQASKAATIAAAAPIETFAVEEAADWQADDVRPTREGTRFRVFYRGDFVAEIALRIPGRHNVANALAASALAHSAGAPCAAIREALAEFPGICRRFEPVGSWRGVALIDDYAHHPTAIGAVLATARERFPNRRLWCVFQPHQVSRTRALFADFAHSLSAADRVLVLPVFAAREDVHDEPLEASRELAAEVATESGPAQFEAGVEPARAVLEQELEPGDVLITMGAGDVGNVHRALTRRMHRHHPAERIAGPAYLAESRCISAVFHVAAE